MFTHSAALWAGVKICSFALQGGLFEDIAEGLRHAELMIACVSDEYAKSKNCLMELRFAIVSLKIPVVVAVVGTGFKWEASEVRKICHVSENKISGDGCLLYGVKFVNNLSHSGLDLLHCADFQAGMLCLATPKLSFQYQSPETMNRMVDVVKKYLSDEKASEDDQENAEAEAEDRNENAFQV